MSGHPNFYQILSNPTWIEILMTIETSLIYLKVKLNNLKS